MKKRQASFERIDLDAEVRRRLENTRSLYGDHPLVDDLVWLSEHYLRLAERLRKITRISDNLQSQVVTANKSLSQLAATDPLTGLFNRAGILQRAQLARTRLVEASTPFGLLMIDLDFFKVINDQLGHAAGDRVLVEVARRLRASIRVTDYCARWGGEEFLVLLPDMTSEGLDRVADKLLNAVSGAPLELDDSPPLSLACSIGAYLGESEESADESISKADRALYRAKYSGRGRVVRYERMSEVEPGESQGAATSPAPPPVSSV